MRMRVKGLRVLLVRYFCKYMQDRQRMRNFSAPRNVRWRRACIAWELGLAWSERGESSLAMSVRVPLPVMTQLSRARRNFSGQNCLLGALDEFTLEGEEWNEGSIVARRLRQFLD
jgi:hypothetical protein